MVCPPKHDPEWKRLLVELNGDERLASRIWKKYGETIPSTEVLIKEGYVKSNEVPKFQAAIDSLQERVKFLYRRLSSIKGKARAAKDADEKADLNRQVQRTEKLIKGVEDRIEDLKDNAKYTALEDIYSHANEDLKYVSDSLDKNDTLTFADIAHMLRITNLWSRVGKLDERNPFFNEAEMEAFKDKENETFQDIARNYKNIQAQAEILEDRINGLLKKEFQNEVYKTFGKDAEIDYDATIKDINKLFSVVMDIGEIDNIITKAMHVWNKAAHARANQEAQEIFDGIEKVMKVVKKRFTNEQLEDIFAQRQSNTDDRKTKGLVFRYSQTWFDWNRLRSDRFKSKLDKAEGETKKNLIQENIKEYKKHTVMFDARLLFPEKGVKVDTKAVEDHKKELISHLGQKGFDFYYERMKQKIQEYNTAKEAEYSVLKDMYGENIAVVEQLMEEWTIENSPYTSAESYYTSKVFKVSDKYVSTSNKYTEVVPRRTVDGKDMGYYDKNFAVVEADKDLLALYDYMIGTIHELNSYLPDDIKKEMHSNTLPYIEKSVMNSFLQGNLGKSFGSMRDLWIKAITTNMGGTREQSSQRDIEGNKIDELRFSGFTDNQKVIKDYVDRRIIEYRLANKAEPTIDQKLEWRRVIENELSEKRSYDFESILKLYSLAVTQYKHKAMVEDAMTTAYNILRKTAKQQLTNAGEPKHNQFGRPIGKEGLSNMMEAVDYFMKGYYGQPTSLQEMPFGDKIYTSEEKKIKEDVEKLLEENQQKLESGEVKIEDYIKNKEKLEGQLVGLGGRKTVSAIGDQVNMWIRLRGLGWNLFAPIMNMNVGFFTNLTEASGGIRFNQEQLMRGYALALIKDTKKVSNIMRRYDTLKEIQNEAYATQSVARGWKKWLSPFYTTNRAEYVNQSPVMVAVLLNTKVIVDGKEMNLYDAHDENGNLPENIEYVSKIPVVTSLKDIGVKIVIDDTIARIHGNYDPQKAIKANETILGRSLMIFRKWMIMSYYNRLGSQDENISPVTGFRDKGRWLSYGKYFKEYGAFGGVFQATLNILKKFTFGMYSTDFSKLDEVDAANMRKNLTEIVFIMSVTSLALMLKALTKMGDDDDEMGTAKYLAFFYINQLGRLERDIMFYIDPQQFKSVLKDPLPVMGLVGDSYDIVTRAFNLITGGEDTYQSGYRKGNSKTWTSIKKITPGASNIDRLKSLTEKVIDN